MNVLWLLSLVSIVSAVKIDVKNSPNGMTVTCMEEASDASRIGTITDLGLETVSNKQVTRFVENGSPDYLRRVTHDETVVESVVTLSGTGDANWGKDYAGTDRLTINGSIKPGNSSISVVYKSIRCWDGPSVVCAARGYQGTSDSKPHYLLVEVPPSDVTIYGGQNCPSSHKSRDGCDIFANDGDKMELTCTARIGQPLYNNAVTWHSMENPDKKFVYRTEMRNSSIDSCEGEVTSQLTYTFLPQQDSEMETVKCSVEMDRQTDKMTISKEFTVCRFTSTTDSSWFSPANGVFTRKHIIGIFFAGFGCMLVLLILILFVMCCCGCRLGVRRKNQMDLRDDYHGKG